MSVANISFLLILQPTVTAENPFQGQPTESNTPIDVDSIHTVHHKHFNQDPVYIEWVVAAMVLDRLCFYVFMVTTVISTTVLMTCHP